MPITQYTVSNFVANALAYYSRNNGIPGFEPQEVNFDNSNNSITKNKRITLWRIKKI